MQEQHIASDMQGTEPADLGGGRSRGQASPYSTRSWGTLSEMKLPPRECFWGDLFAMRQLHVIFGQGGLGKSRISLNMARNQVLGLPFCNFSMGDRPLRHLLMGSENSTHRLQKDVLAMSKDLTSAQIELLENNVFLATLENPGDAFINVGDDENLRRWEVTIAQTKPDVVWIDPWGDILMGDGTDRDVRETLTILQKLVRSVNPEAGLVVMAHSRTGANNISLAGGFGAADFGKGSKALYSAARAVVNLAPYDESSCPEIVTVCAKSNDAPVFEPFRMLLDNQTMTYGKSKEPVDLEVWREQVKAVGVQKRCKARATMKPRVDFKVMLSAVRKMVEGGAIPQTEVIERLVREQGLSQRDAKAVLKAATTGDNKFLTAERSKTTPSRNMCSLLGSGGG